MRTWLEAGYLSADLLIGNGSPKNQFRKLADWFPNAIVAFLPPNQAKSPSSEVAKEGEWYFLDKNQKVQGPFGDFVSCPVSNRIESDLTFRLPSAHAPMALGGLF